MKPGAWWRTKRSKLPMAWMSFEVATMRVNPCRIRRPLTRESNVTVKNFHWKLTGHNHPTPAQLERLIFQIEIIAPSRPYCVTHSNIRWCTSHWPLVRQFFWLSLKILSVKKLIALQCNCFSKGLKQRMVWPNFSMRGSCLMPSQ